MKQKKQKPQAREVFKAYGYTFVDRRTYSLFMRLVMAGMNPHTAARRVQLEG